MDTSQLPEELGGQLPYQHKQWVKNRLVIDFNKYHTWKSPIDLFFSLVVHLEAGNL